MTSTRTSSSLTVDLSWLPPPRPPFLVRDIFAMRADLYPLGKVYNGHVEATHFTFDDQYPSFVRAKLTSLRECPSRYAPHLDDDPGGLGLALWRVLEELAREWPDLAHLVGRVVELPALGVRLDGSEDTTNPTFSRLPGDSPLGWDAADWLESRQGIERLGDALALACQEDLVIMRGQPKGGGVAEWLHVCLPSGWDPEEKLGLGFEAIHEPVADNQRLVNSGPNVMKAMLSKGPYVRFGWSLTTVPDLNAHPAKFRPWNETWTTDPEQAARHTFVRMERQSTLAMPELNRALFTIRIHLTPLVERITAEPSLQPRMAELLRTCSPAVVAYKGMTRLAAPVLAWLENNVDDSQAESQATSR